MIAPESSQNFLQKNPQQKTNKTLPDFSQHFRPSTSTFRPAGWSSDRKVAAAEIQGFEANAEHYLVVKEGSGDNGRARIRQQGGEMMVISEKKNTDFNKKPEGWPYTGI